MQDDLATQYLPWDRLSRPRRLALVVEGALFLVFLSSHWCCETHHEHRRRDKVWTLRLWKCL